MAPRCRAWWTPHGPDVVLMDLRMPRMDGIAATKRLRARVRIHRRCWCSPRSTPTSTWSGRFEPAPAASCSRTRRRRGSWPRSSAVAAGEPMLSPGVTRRLMERVAADAGDYERARAALAELSPRERDVVLAVARGLSNADIGVELRMSLATVKAHLTHIFGQARRGEPDPDRADRTRRRPDLTLEWVRSSVPRSGNGSSAPRTGRASRSARASPPGARDRHRR